MSESVIIVRAPSSTTKVSVEELATKISTIVGVKTSAVTSTAQALCVTHGVYNLVSNWQYNPQAYSVFPALAAPTRIRYNPITNENDLVRHGILVETYAPQHPRRPIYVYIGGVSSSWESVEGLAVFQGGKVGYVTTPIIGEQISYALNSQYPIIVAPVQYKLYSSRFRGPPRRFVNPPNVPPCAQDLWNKVGGILQSSSSTWASFVPSYVHYIYSTLNYYPDLYEQEPGTNRWDLDYGLVDALETISDHLPLFYAGLITKPQTMLIAGISSIFMDYKTILLFGHISLSVLIDLSKNPFPMLNGAPAYTANLCSKKCGLQLAGFVVAASDIQVPTTTLDTVQVQLIAPPKDFTYESLREYASRLGQLSWFDQLMSHIFKAFDVISVLTTTYGVPQSIAEKAVEAIDWFGEEFAKPVQEIAQDIYNELNSPEHDVDTHTDQAGQEVHNAYMCVRFCLDC